MTTRMPHGRSPRPPSVIPTKFEHGTYDMNDESHTDQSYPDSPVISSGHSAYGLATPPPTCEKPFATEMKAKSHESTDMVTLSKDEAEKSSISWSDSEGSTFFSESNRVERGDEETDYKRDFCDFMSLDVVDPKEDPEPVSRTATHQGQPRLQNVDYFSEVQIASCSSDEVSIVEFISKESTRQIFERRMVPLEVSARRRRLDDVSAFSSTKASFAPKEPSVSLPAQTRNGLSNRIPREPSLENVEGVSDVEVATNDHDRNTASCCARHRVAEAAFETIGVPKKILAFDLKVDDISLISSPQAMMEITVKRRIDSLSTLGSTSARSKSLVGSSPSYEDDGSCEAIRRKVETTPFCADKRQKSKETFKEVLLKRTTNTRIQDLKERIRRLQEVSSLEPGPGRFESERLREKGPNSPQRTTYKAEIQRNFVNEATVGNQDYSKPVSSSPEPAICISRHVPSEVRPVLENQNDDLSTIACELNHENESKYELIDVELGTETRHKTETNMQHCSKFDGVKQRATRILQSGSTKTVSSAASQLNTALQQYRIYQYIQGLWATHMRDRPAAEKAIIATIFLSCFVLFILLLSIATS